jgi:hypothetical protein
MGSCPASPDYRFPELRCKTVVEWGGMLNYLTGHQERLSYAVRLRRGQAIGSGRIEGAAKNVIGRRLKANNAR